MARLSHRPLLDSRRARLPGAPNTLSLRNRNRPCRLIVTPYGYALQAAGLCGRERIPPIRPDRIRDTRGGFAFIPGRFLRDGFVASLGHRERSLYLFFVLAADRNGVSDYSQDRIHSLLELPLDEYIALRDSLIAFDGACFQVLSLPSAPSFQPRAFVTREDLEEDDPAARRSLLTHELRLRR